MNKVEPIQGVLARVIDRRGRPLYAVKTNGRVVYYRYHDMSAGEREIILRFFHAIRDLGMANEIDEEASLLDFLDFKNDVKICG